LQLIIAVTGNEFLELRKSLYKSAWGLSLMFGFELPFQHQFATAWPGAWLLKKRKTLSAQICRRVLLNAPPVGEYFPLDKNSRIFPRRLDAATIFADCAPCRRK
jgi:hypothetical protein